MIVSIDEDLEMLLELVVAVVVIAFDGGVLDDAVQPQSCGRSRVKPGPQLLLPLVVINRITIARD